MGPHPWVPKMIMNHISGEGQNPLSHLLSINLGLFHLNVQDGTGEIQNKNTGYGLRKIAKNLKSCRKEMFSHAPSRHLNGIVLIICI